MKVICTIPARLNSKRLPKKLILKIADKPVLQHTIEQVKKAKKVDEIWIVTPKIVDNKEIWDIAKAQNVGLYAGDEIDIISRILIVANDRKADYIVNVDGEQPMTDPFLIDEAVKILEHGKPYIEFGGLPLGASPIAFTRDKLKDVYARHYTKIDYNWKRFFLSKESYCVDTQDDYERIKELMESGTH